MVGDLHISTSLKNASVLSLGGGVHPTMKFPVPGEELLSLRRKRSPTGVSTSTLPLDELEARSRLEVPKVAPGMSVGHAETLGGGPNRPKLPDRLQELGAASPDLHGFTEREPDPQLRLHDRTPNPHVSAGRNPTNKSNAKRAYNGRPFHLEPHAYTPLRVLAQSRLGGYVNARTSQGTETSKGLST